VAKVSDTCSFLRILEAKSLKRILFIGGGNMARAIIGGLCQDSCQPLIHVVEPNEAIAAGLRDEFACSTSAGIGEAADSADVVVLAVKPDVVPRVCEFLRPRLRRQIIVSIVSGLTCTQLDGWLSGKCEVVRAMPNTPALVRSGMTGLFALHKVSHTARGAATAMFEAVGKVLWTTDESMIDAMTAISGSGPAYMFYLVEALAGAAESLGFSPEQARTLAETTAIGSMSLLNCSDESASQLRTRVTSKGGTTAAAISMLEKCGVREAITDAAQAARARAVELRTVYS